MTPSVACIPTLFVVRERPLVLYLLAHRCDFPTNYNPVQTIM